MPQAKLPDINAAFVKYRSYGLICMDIGNYKGAIASLNGINALLPDEYRVEIDSTKYYDMVQSKTTVFCSNCEAEYKRNLIQIKTILLPNLQNMVSGQEYFEGWICKKCGYVNSLKNTRVKQTKLQLPFYAKVVPSPPERKDGLINRRDYKSKMSQWFYQFLEELEYQLGNYRKEYVSIFSEESMAEQVQDVEL